jgi:hypothetical protein
MQIARVEAELEATLSPDSSCSVLWLVPEAEGEDLGMAVAAVAELSAMTAWGFIGTWERSKLLGDRAAAISNASRLSAEYAISATRMKADMLELPFPNNNWFWAHFGTAIRPHQICGVLLPAAAPETGGWTYAGLQLVLSAAARQARPSASYEYTLRALEQAFLAEIVVAGGIGVTRLRAELLRPGIALTSTRNLIDSISAALGDARAIDPLLVERSRLLRGSW